MDDDMENVLSLTQLYEQTWHKREIRRVCEKFPAFVGAYMFFSPLRHEAKVILTPLHYVLRKENCLEAVRLLLEHGADPNEPDENEATPLEVALFCCRDVEVVRALIEKGATVDSTETAYLCTAFASGCSKDVIELLLKSGCLLNECKKADHFGSVLHCAMDTSKKRAPVSVDVLRMLMDRGAYINAVNGKGQCVICFALHRDNEEICIRMLLEAAGALSRCPTHSSYLMCATGQMKTPLKASIVEMLLKFGVSPNEVNRNRMNALQCALLRKRASETKAIELLLDCYEGVDLNSFLDTKGNSLLHLAVKNTHCLASVVELLIQRGVKVNNLNMYGLTALCGAVTNSECKLSILEVLVRNGASVNYHDMKLALEKLPSIEIVKLLCIACASLCQAQLLSLIRLVSSQVIENECQWVCLKYLAKLHFLKFSDHCFFKVFEDNPEYYRALNRFRHGCVQELKKMKTKKISRRHTLHDFLIPRQAPFERYDFDQLLDVIEPYPIYFDFITEKVGRPQIVAKLEGLQVYAVKCPPSDPHSALKIFLTYDCLLTISMYLNDEDLLRLVLAFYNEDGRLPDTENRRERKRKAKEPQLVGKNRCLSSKRRK